MCSDSRFTERHERNSAEINALGEGRNRYKKMGAILPSPEPWSLPHEGIRLTDYMIKVQI